MEEFHGLSWLEIRNCYSFLCAALIAPLAKNLPVGGLGLIPGLRRSPGERETLPTPVLWPGEFHGLCRPWCRKELDTIENFHFTVI